MSGTIMYCRIYIHLSYTRNESMDHDNQRYRARGKKKANLSRQV